MRRLTGIFLLLLFFAFPSLAHAVAQTWFVNTDCANNGDGSLSTCAGAPAGAGAFTTLDNAITGITPKNFVTNTITGTIDLRGATQDNSTADISGFTTNASFSLTIVVQTANRHGGYRDATKYTLANGNTAVFTLATRVIILDGLQILSTSNNNGAANHGIAAYNNAAVTSGYTPIARNNLILKSGTSTFASSGIFFEGSSANWSNGFDFQAYNNAVGTIAGAVPYANGILCHNIDSCNCKILENTIRGASAIGLDLIRTPGLCTILSRAYNNLVSGSGTSDYSNTGTCGTVDTATNQTSDATSPNGASFQSLTAANGPLGSTDFRLLAGDTVAKNRGTDLNGTGKLSYLLDFIGTSRPQGVAYDLGANEMIGTGPTPTPTPSGGSFPALGVGN